MFTIDCKVTGGVTGTRYGKLKEEGDIKVFGTRENAQAKCNSLNKTMNAGFGSAQYRYTVAG